MTNRLERELRSILIKPTFWLVLACFTLAFVLGYGWLTNTRINREQAIREAELAAAHEAIVSRCLATRPQLLSLTRHIQGVNTLADVLVENNLQLLKSTSPFDPLYQARRENLRRLIAARKMMHAIASFPVPTVAECRKG